MNNVSRTLRGQSSSSGSLRVVAGALCVAMCAPVFASNGQGTKAGTQSPQVIGETTHKVYLKARIERETRRDERRIESESTQVPEDVTRSMAQPDSSSTPRGNDRRGLKRALADSSDAAAAEQRKNLTREERRALKRELRDALQGANSDDTPAH